MKLNILQLLLYSFLLISMKSADDFSEPQSPENELKSLQLADGFNIELAVSEPLVEDPVYIDFDEKGRMWVIEMRAYMPNIDGKGEEEPIGRVSYLEDTNADGQFDKRTTYADGLILPRALFFYQDGVLIAENIPLWFYEDTNGDGKGDKRTLVDSTYGGGGLPEHSANGLLLGLDNWLYNAKSEYRYKRTGNSWVKEETEFRGQWGISKDDFGRLYYNYNWSQLHADLVPPNYLNRNAFHESSTGTDQVLSVERAVFPIGPTPAVNRGYIPGVLDKDGKLTEFTSACSPFVSRDRGYYPEDFYGNVLVCEPAGNLVKRNIVNENGNYLEATNAYEGKEFLVSTDERFRPVHIKSGPDGAIYLVDMYRGINQHKAYMTEYLREQTLNRGLDKYIHLGRIWKITPKGYKATAFADLSTQNGVQLAENLEHPISWFRDTSQRLLVQQKRTDAKSKLEEIALNGTVTARISALWVLEGLNVLEPSFCLQLLNDENAKIQANALRLLEAFSKTDKSLIPKMEKSLKKSIGSNDVTDLQLLLSSYALQEAYAIEAVSKIISEKGNDLLLTDAALSSLGNRELKMVMHILKDKKWKEKSDFKEMFLEQLAGILIKRRGADESSKFIEVITKAQGWQKSSLLIGASLQVATSEKEPVVLKNKPPLFESQESSREIQNLQKGFNWPGKQVIKAKEVEGIKLDAAGMKQFVAGRRLFLNYCTGCHGSDGAGLKRFAPPLVGSEWVIQEPEKLALILLYGIEGAIKVKGKTYDVPDILPVMPSHSTLSNQEVADVMTYIRNEWGHNSEAISGREIGMLRLKTQGKVVPWTAEELMERMANKKTEN